MYALMQACGLVNDHLAACWVRDEVQAEQDAALAVVLAVLVNAGDGCSAAGG
jgi:hypothetical protein